MSVASVEEDIIAAGAEIIWVMEQTPANAPGTAQNCFDFMSSSTVNSDKGWCVGDSQTLPTAYTFDNSPFSIGRGFDLLVPRGSMVIEFESSHGTPGGNENLDGAAILAEVQALVASLP